MRTFTLRFLFSSLPLLLALAGSSSGAAAALCSAAGKDEGAGAGDLTLHVSPTGNDVWSGRSAEANADRSDGPLATIAAAQDRIRRLKTAPGGLRAPVTVLLRGGVYRQATALVFTPADSGTRECPVTYAARAGEHPVISGGKRITGWMADDGAQSRERCGGKLWRADLPEGDRDNCRFVNQLFVNGRRRPRARIPNQREFLRSDGPVGRGDARSFRFKEGDLKEWPDLRNVVLVVYHSWETSIHHIRGIDTGAALVTLREPAPWPMGRWEKRQRYYVENVLEGLDAPGEWHLDPGTGRFRYYPLPGETMAGIEVVAPAVVSTLLEFRGEPAQGAYVEHVHFRGLSFQHSNAQLRRFRNPGQGEIYQPGLIQAVGLRQANFIDCEVAHTGAHGIWLAEGCADVRVERCHIHDLGGGGVYIGGGWGRHEGAPTTRVTVHNCFIHDGSHQFHGAHGVWIGRSSFNAVTHNEIANLDYSGISCGWSWGFQPSSAHHNILDHNHIHHLGNGDGLSDMGGIYTLGISPGTTERHNRIHDIYSYAHVSHGSGIYPDEGSSEILIEHNVVYRVRTCPLFQHYGKDNVIRNNVFALGAKGQLQRSREDVPCHYAATRNVVYGDIPEMLGGVWRNGDWTLEQNLYWSTAGTPTFAGMQFAQWQAKGNDKGSIVADPLFVNPQAGDFRLRPGSPAETLGFEPIDPARTGLQGDPTWVALPKRYPNRTLKEIAPPVDPPFIINLDFEGEPAGAAPLDGTIIEGENGASIRVSAESAASGSQSLKFTDAPGQKHAWTPHIYYHKTYSDGQVRISWDMCNSKDAPARFSIEARQYDGGRYKVGPTVAVMPDGTVSASGRKLAAVPLGAWVHVEIDVRLGQDAPAAYRLTLRVPGRDPLAVKLPHQDKAFREIHWLGISTLAQATGVFYIDNLKMGTAEELARPPIRRRAPRPAPRVAPLANAQGLAAHWTFDDPDNYTADDLSGCGNDADVQSGWAKGTFGTALLCDGTGPGATVGDAPGLRFGTGDFSVALWICPTDLEIDSTQPHRRFLDKNQYPRTWWNLNVTTDGRPFIEMHAATGATCVNRPSGTIRAHAWTHLAIVVDRARSKTLYYYNGALDSARDIPAGFTGALDVEGGDLAIGSGWQPFIGLLDDIRVYRRTLDPAEVRSLHERTRGGYTSAAHRTVE